MKILVQCDSTTSQLFKISSRQRFIIIVDFRTLWIRVEFYERL
jgi:hypothetical protein